MLLNSLQSEAGVAMAYNPEHYFDRIAQTKQNLRGERALASLDIIDTKAGGIAGLIGGFSAAATIAFGHAWQNWSFGPASIILGFALLCFAISGLACAGALVILSHKSIGFLVDLNGPESADEQAGKRMCLIYR